MNCRRGVPNPYISEGVIFLGEVALVNQTWNDMTILNAKIVVRSINIGGNDTGKVTSIFFSIGAIHGINQSFGVGISFIGCTGGPSCNMVSSMG